MHYLKPGPCPGRNKTWLHHEVKYRTDFLVLYRILCEAVKTSVECRWTFLVICTVPNLGYSPDSYLKLKYVVKKCGDISSYHRLYFWNALNPLSLKTLFFSQVAKCFFPMYPVHCFCSYVSDFSLKNMYNSYHRTCSCTHSLSHRFLFDFFHVFWGTSRSSCTLLSVFCSVRSALCCLGCRFKFCCCIFSFLEFFCWFHQLLFKSLPVFSVICFYCSLSCHSDYVYHLLYVYQVSFSKTLFYSLEKVVFKNRLFHQVSRQCSFLPCAAESFQSSYFLFVFSWYTGRRQSRSSIY